MWSDAVADLLQLPDLKAVSVRDEDGCQVIEAGGDASVSNCPECRGALLYRHGVQVQSYRDTPMHGKPAVLSLHRRRYRCQDCGTTFFEPLAALG